MGSQYIQDMVQNLKEGRVSRRSFIQRMAALGVTAPIATQILAWNDVAMANATLEYKPTKAGGGGPLKMLLWQAPTLLNPHFASGTKDQIASRIFYEPLAGWDKEGNLFPQLAAEVPSKANGGLSEDGKVVTWKLKQGVKWHDGKPFTADDVVFTWEYAADPATAAYTTGAYANIKVEKVDDHTVKVMFKEPTPFWADPFVGVAGMIIPKHHFGDYKGAKSREAPANLKPVGTGPYKFVERVQNDRIVLEKFKEHWEADKYNFDRIIYRAIPDTTVRLANLRSGELDMLERLAPTDVKSAKADSSLKVESIANLGYQGITINTRNGDAAKQPMGQDKRVRQALSLAIDRKVLSQVVFEGLYEPMNQPFNPGNFYLSSDFPVPERDVAKAKALLKAAGHEKVSVELFVTNNPVDNQLGQVLQAMAQEAGIDIQIRSTEFASQLRDQQQGKFQMSRIGWSGRIDPDGNIHPFVTTGGGQNDGKYSNPEVDRLLNQARTVYDPAERKKLYDAAQKILQDELPIVYLYNQTVFFALRKNLDGFVINPDGMIRLAGLKRS